MLPCQKSSNLQYRKIASTHKSRLEAHADFFRLLMKGIVNPYVLWPFDKKLISWLVKRVRTPNYMGHEVVATEVLCNITSPKAMDSNH